MTYEAFSRVTIDAQIKDKGWEVLAMSAERAVNQSSVDQRGGKSFPAMLNPLVLRERFLAQGASLETRVSLQAVAVGRNEAAFQALLARSSSGDLPNVSVEEVAA